MRATGSASADADQPWSSHGRVSLSERLRLRASACAASASSRMYGVRNIRSSLRDSDFETLPKSHLPIHGMSLSIGMPVSDSATEVSVRPPRTTVCLSSSRTSAAILRSTARSTLPGTYMPPCGMSIDCPFSTNWVYSSSTLSMTVPLGLIFGVILSFMPMSFEL